MGGNPPGPFGGGLRPNPPRVETAGFRAGSFAENLQDAWKKSSYRIYVSMYGLFAYIWQM